jgi:hypothetical protein
MSDTYTILCVIEGENTSFGIKIQSHEIVHFLKKEIKTEKANMLAGIDADDLKLFRVDIEDGDDLKDKVDEEMKKSPKALVGSKRLSRLFDPAPAEDHVHFIVSLPPGRSLTKDPPFKLFLTSGILDRNHPLHIIVRPPPGEACLLASIYTIVKAG